MKASTQLREDIRRAAAHKGMAQLKDIAAAMSITPTYLTDIFKERKRLTPQLVDRAIEALKVHPVRGQRWHRLGAVESGWRIDSRLG